MGRKFLTGFGKDSQPKEKMLCLKGEGIN